MRMLHFCGKTSNAGVQANTPLSDHLETKNPAAQGSVPCPRPLGNVDFRQRAGGRTSHRVYISIEITIATIRPRLLEVGSLRVA